ncbi:MAG: VWA domain-containing protein [Kofleriaceae bacterium]|nr:VWA domain-containing protein [Myxococcales bacterium]MCB9559295.1 VWA domain-containing protein [Kofleriaceae bacterium]
MLALTTPLAAGLAGCIDRPITEVDPGQDKVENLSFTVDLNRNLDLLFVVDNSGSMEREQLQITENFKRMIEVLETLPGGLPNIHLGVVSTDVGAGASCVTPSPGPGVLRNAAMVPGCTPPSGRYIEDVDDGNGGRARNYTGALDDTFACIATLGTDGCGFEQPLEALRLALSPSTTLNSGFLRDDAILAVVILSDEDDCSAFNPDLFTSNTDVLGPRENFRCFEQGIECDGVDPHTEGVRENCVPRSDSPYITPIEEYVDFLRGLKRSDNQLVVAGILGDASPVRIGRNERNNLDVLRSCDIGVNDPQGAFPPIRTDALLAQFPRSVRTRICDADLSPAIVEVAQVIRDSLLPACVLGNLVDANPAVAGIQADCSVVETQHPGAADEATAILPQCGPTNPADAPTTPCWSIQVDEEVCDFTASHREVAAHYPSTEPRDPDTLIDVQCQTQ